MGDTETIVFLHGFTHSGTSWGPVVAGLGKRYKAIAPDIRGHASASEAEPVTLPAVLADIGALAPVRFALCGYSQGGRIALHAALAMPERISRMVLIGASPGIADPTERKARLQADMRLADELERMPIEALAARWERTPVLAGLPPSAAARAHADRLRSTPAGLARALRGLGTGTLPSLWSRLPELTLPVTLIAGERDPKFAAIAEQMASEIPHASVTIVPGAGHAVHLERPEAVVSALVPVQQPVAEPGTGGR